MHEHKKGGHRKDKKVERMREDLAERKLLKKTHPTTDQPDIQAFKPGHPGDKNRQP